MVPMLTILVALLVGSYLVPISVYWKIKSELNQLCSLDKNWEEPQCEAEGEIKELRARLKPPARDTEGE